jgi:hypothetical protein
MLLFLHALYFVYRRQDCSLVVISRAIQRARHLMFLGTKLLQESHRLQCVFFFVVLSDLDPNRISKSLNSTWKTAHPDA